MPLRRQGETVTLGNQERGYLILTPNEDGTIEVCADWPDEAMTAVTIARSEARRLHAALGQELGL